MPFSPKNRRFTFLSIVTVVLSLVAYAAMRAGQVEMVKVLLLVLGPVSVLWDGERRSKKTREAIAAPLTEVSEKARTAADKAEKAVAVTAEAFATMERELAQIKKGLNGELDQRIIATVDKAMDARFDARLDVFAAKIVDHLTKTGLPKIIT